MTMSEENKKYRVHRMIGIFPTLSFEIDDVDVPLKNPKISNLDIFFLISSILMHIIDMVIDVNLAVRYLIGNKIEYFVWTISFIYIPSFINVIVSMRMQYQDKVNLRTDQSQNHEAKQLIIKKNICCIIATVFQLAPVIHYYDALKYALKSRKCAKAGDQDGQRRYYLKMLKEDQDVVLLRVFECFLEAAPHQVLQITILLKNYDSSINLEFFHQVASITSSLIGMGWAMASYNRSIRLAQQDKLNINAVGGILQFLWHFCVTASRIVSISIVASIWPLYVAVGCMCHWLIMTIFIVSDPRGVLEFCRHHNRVPHTLPTLMERFCSVLFAGVIGLVYVFIYLNTVEGSTFWKHVSFHLIYLLENIALSMIWLFTASIEVQNEWHFNVLTVMCIVPFILGTVSMILYYTMYHPTVKTKRLSCISFSET